MACGPYPWHSRQECSSQDAPSKMCGALEQGACDSRGKPKNGAGGIPAEKWSRPPKGNATVEGAGEGYSGAESVGSAGCVQQTNGQEDSLPLAGG